MENYPKGIRKIEWNGWKADMPNKLSCNNYWRTLFMLRKDLKPCRCSADDHLPGTGEGRNQLECPESELKFSLYALER